METQNKFEADPTITAAVEAVLAVVGERGSVLLHADIARASGCDPYTGSWATIVKKVRKRLETERLQPTWPETGIGYRLLTHQEAVMIIPQKRQQRMYWQAGRALKEMQTADPSQLSMTERRLLASQLDRLAMERKNLRAAQKELLQASQTLPRRQLAET